MLRVYLDQNKWIELARSRQTGFTDDLGDIWYLAARGVEAGLLSFPLSAVHFYETSKRVDRHSRWNLAATMAALSRMHAIAGPNTLVPLEVEAAVAKIAPDPQPVPPIQAFGIGAAHALGATRDTFLGRFSLEELRAAGMPQDIVDLVARGTVDPVDMAILARTESSSTAQALAALTRTQMGSVDRKFAEAQRAYAEGVKTHRLKHRRDEGLSRFDLMDVMPLFTRACAKRGFVLAPEQFRDIEVVERLLRQVPSKWVVRELRRVRHRNPQQPWTESDLNDVNGLSGAVVYCDVVVTERQWAHHLNKEGLSELHGTKVLSDLHQLPTLLVAQSKVDS